MKSKYLIGLIPSIFILMIACFARAAPIEDYVAGHKSTLILEPAIMLLFGAALIALATGFKRKKQ